MANKLKDLTGKKFGSLLVLRRDTENIKKGTRWICQCDCGNVKSILGNNLTTNTTKSCGCKRYFDIVGKKYGRLLVIGKTKYKDHYKWICQCDCGNITEVYSSSLISGKVISCGCYHKEELIERLTTHNLSKHRLYMILAKMKQRCYNLKNNRYKDYGGKGIKVCDEWKNDFMSFYNWSMQNGYKEGLTIDRIDVNGNYEPSNCRWVDAETQANNKRNSIFITIKNKTRTLKQWTNFMNWDYQKYYARYRRGKQIFNNQDIKKIEEEMENVRMYKRL